MIRDILGSGGFPIHAQIGLILFVLLFAAIVFRTLSGRRDRFKYESEMPLEDGLAFSENKLKSKAPRSEDTT